MLELSLHILDIVENSLSAGADKVEIGLEVDEAGDAIRIVVSDNGRGMPEEMVARVLDPFYTTRTTRRVGLGLPLLRQAAEQAEGWLTITSRPGEGSRIEAFFRLSHLDRVPLGNMKATLMTLIVGRPDVDIIYTQKKGTMEFVLDTREIKETLDGVPIFNPEVMRYLDQALGDGLAELGNV